MKVVFVHGACVRDGAWWWHRAASVLEEQGVSSSAPRLPSCGEGGSPAGVNGPGLTEDVASVREELQASDDPTVVVAHSYGGIVTAQAAAGMPSVRHVVLVSSYLPEPGESLADFGDGSPSPNLDVDPAAGTFTVREDVLGEVYLQDCTSDIRDEAPRHLARQSLHVVTAPVTAAAWRDVPTTYVVCTDDRGTPVAAQRAYAQRADRVVEIATGHHPFLSRPDEIGELVLGLRAGSTS